MPGTVLMLLELSLSNPYPMKSVEDPKHVCIHTHALDMCAPTHTHVHTHTHTHILPY